MPRRHVLPQGPGVEALPPPGDARREILAERADALAEAAETAVPEGAAIDPSALDVENELASHFNELEVSHRDPEYAYCWVQIGFSGRYIKMKQVEGWEVVQGDMPEARELQGIGADTTRRLGDVLLMRIRQDRYLLLTRQRAERQRMAEGSVTSELEDVGRRYERYGVRVGPMTEDQMKRAQAQSIAARAVDQMIRDGRMPGVPAPGR